MDVAAPRVRVTVRTRCRPCFGPRGIARLVARLSVARARLPAGCPNHYSVCTGKEGVPGCPGIGGEGTASEAKEISKSITIPARPILQPNGATTSIKCADPAAVIPAHTPRQATRSPRPTRHAREGGRCSALAAPPAARPCLLAHVLLLLLLLLLRAYVGVRGCAYKGWGCAPCYLRVARADEE